MTAGWRAARYDHVKASEALLALRGIENPTRQQKIGALIEAEFRCRFIYWQAKGR